MKFIVFSLILFLIFDLSSTAQEKTIPRHSLGYYLVHGKAIVEATVLKVNKNSFKLKVQKWYKWVNKDRQTIRVHSAIINVGDSIQRTEFKLKSGEKYIFFLGRRYRPVNDFVLREACNRFKVVNDSIYIGYPFISNLPISNQSNFQQPNTFNDEIMPYGYKMSTKDFYNLILIVNESFIPESAQTKYNITTDFSYIYHEPNTTDSFALAIIEDLRQTWFGN